MGIGKRIKEARERLGYTQKELGDLIGVTASAVTNYENETSHPKEAILYKLLEVLNVDANYLFQDVLEQVSKEKADSSNETIDPSAFIKRVYKILVDAGFVEEGTDLTDEQLRFLESVVVMIRTYFQK